MMLSYSRTMEQFKMSSSQRTETSFICTSSISYHLSSPKYEPQPILEYTKPDHHSTNFKMSLKSFITRLGTLYFLDVEPLMLILLYVSSHD